MTVRDTAQTAAWLHSQMSHPTGPKPGGSWEGECLDLQHTARGIPAKYGTAWEAWLNATHRHTLPNARTVFHLIPRGVLLFYRSNIPGHEDGHVVYYDGMGRVGPLCYSNDVPNSAGNVSLCNPLWFLPNWNMTLAGFTEDVNGVEFPVGRPATRVVHLSAVAPLFAHPGSRGATRWVDHQLSIVLAALGLPAADTVSSTAKGRYAAWQRSCGFTGPDADGVPGDVSLTWLGHEHAFEVI